MHEILKTARIVEKAKKPDKTPLEEIELLTGKDAEKLCNIGRGIIYAAMDKYKASKGQLGLAYIVYDGTKRRMIRRASLRRWLESLEQKVLYA